jgi:hypothetical protein
MATGFVDNNDPSSPKSVRARLHEIDALRERAQGKSYRKIAEALNLASATSARNAVMRGLADVGRQRQDLVDEYVAVQLERLRIAVEAIMPRVEEGDLGAIDALIKIESRTARLLALDHPGKWPEDGSGTSQAPGATHQFDNLTDEQLEALRALKAT